VNARTREIPRPCSPISNVWTLAWPCSPAVSPAFEASKRPTRGRSFETARPGREGPMPGRQFRCGPGCLRAHTRPASRLLHVRPTAQRLERAGTAGWDVYVGGHEETGLALICDVLDAKSISGEEAELPCSERPMRFRQSADPTQNLLTYQRLPLFRAGLGFEFGSSHGRVWRVGRVRRRSGKQPIVGAVLRLFGCSGASLESGGRSGEKAT